MTGNKLENTNVVTSKKSTSLRSSLVLWFLLISLLPLTIFSLVSYQVGTDSLTKEAIEKITQSARLNKKFINTWVEYRFMDINYQAENKNNSKFIMDLKDGWKKSGENLKKYVKSYQWTLLSQSKASDLIALSRRYDYIYDVVLIDDEGNILYSFAGERDMGTNLFEGPYANTKFSKTVKETMATGKTRFSDMERYAPSDNRVSGFFTAPLLDEQANKVGVLAIQIQIERVIEILKQKNTDNKTLAHYLVGEDGTLRSPMNDYSDYAEILSRKIETAQFYQWLNEQNEKDSNRGVDFDENAFSYIGPNGKVVIGIHNALELGGTKWVLISEIDESEALASVSWLAKVTLVLFFLTVVFVIFMARFQARRITQPIVKLMNTARSVAAGEINQTVEISANNEIGKLADAFNHMLQMRQVHEQELEKTNAKTKMALAELDDQRFALDQHAIVAVTDIKGNISFVNEKFTEISGYSEAELLGQNHRMLNSGYHEKSFFINMYKTISSGNVWHNEVCNRAKDGSLYWVESTIVPFMGDDGKPINYIVIRTDITRQKAIENELLEAAEVAQVATQLKSEFLANMSHEIRTPMNGVIGMTSLLLDTDLSHKQRDYAENTLKSADALLTIINDILDFSKIEAGKLELEKIPFDLRELAEDVSELMALKCREKNIEMLLRYKPDSLHYMLGDPGRVRQILLNLLSNAVKFTEKGLVLLTIESFIGTNNTVVMLVKVEDTGIGIEQDKLEKIFHKFGQEDGSTTRKFGGTGLGLAICRELCHLMRGDILVQSKKGKGSEFVFTMALEIDQTRKKENKNSYDITLLAGLKVLIVDEVKVSRTILSEQLSNLEMDIEAVGSAAIGLKKIALAIENDALFDIVIVDGNIQEITAEAFAERVSEKELLVDGTLVYVASSPQRGDAERLKKIGFDAYLTKPTRALEVPNILSLVWDAKLKRKPLELIVSRHSLSSKIIGAEKKIRLANAHILLTEDNPINQMVATEYLEGYGCTITPAGNGLEALEKIASQGFDLIFMDCQMPEMDGFEATKEIRKRNIKSLTSNEKNIPIIAFTANAMQGDREQCLAVGMDDFISKPINANALESVLSKWLPHRIVERLGAIIEESVPTIKDGLFADSLNFDKNMFNSLKKLFKNEFPAVVEKHAESTLENVALIQLSIDTDDFKTLERAAHSIKGASGQFGAVGLSGIAAEIEKCAENHDMDKIKEIFLALRVEQKQISEIMFSIVKEP